MPGDWQRQKKIDKRNFKYASLEHNGSKLLKLFDCRRSEISGIPPIHPQPAHTTHFHKAAEKFSSSCFLCDSQQFSRSAGVIESNEEEKTTERGNFSLAHRRMTRKRLYHSKICSRPTPHNVLGWENMKIPSIYISSRYTAANGSIQQGFSCPFSFSFSFQLPPTIRHTVIIIIIAKCCVVTKKPNERSSRKSRVEARAALLDKKELKWMDKTALFEQRRWRREADKKEWRKFSTNVRNCSFTTRRKSANLFYSFFVYVGDKSTKASRISTWWTKKSLKLWILIQLLCRPCDNLPWQRPKRHYCIKFSHHFA